MNTEHSHNDVDVHTYLAAHALHLLRCSSLGASGILTHTLQLTGQLKREMRVDTTCTRARRRCQCVLSGSKVAQPACEASCTRASPRLEMPCWMHMSGRQHTRTHARAHTHTRARTHFKELSLADTSATAALAATNFAFISAIEMRKPDVTRAHAVAAQRDASVPSVDLARESRD